MSKTCETGNVTQKGQSQRLLAGVISRCRSHPPKTRTITTIMAPASSIPVTVVTEALGGYHGVGGGGWGCMLCALANFSNTTVQAGAGVGVPDKPHLYKQ